MTGYAATYRHTISVEEGGEDGDCLHMRNGYHQVIEGFPNCVVADAVINFFMGRTEKVQQVGFNPRMARRGHLGEFVTSAIKYINQPPLTEKMTRLLDSAISSKRPILTFIVGTLSWPWY